MFNQLGSSVELVASKYAEILPPVPRSNQSGLSTDFLVMMVVTIVGNVQLAVMTGFKASTFDSKQQALHSDLGEDLCTVSNHSSLDYKLT